MTGPDVEKRRILITGCGRSGTRYVVALLIKHGLDVRHEAVGRDGSASWCMAVDASKTPWGPPRRDYLFDQVFHQVRSPLKAIPSITQFKPKSWKFAAKWCEFDPGDSLLMRAAKYWLHWNEHAEKIADWRYRIEDFQTCYYPEFCERLGLQPSQDILEALATDINTRSHGRLLHLYDEFCLRVGLYPSDRVRHYLATTPKKLENPPSLTRDELLDLNGDLCVRILNKAAYYGYDL